jgi:hypothetical protein
VGEFWRTVGALLLGAIISFGATFYFEWRKERRTDRTEQQGREREPRQAGRLVYEELNDAWIVLNQTTDTELWWSSPPYDLDSSVWHEYKATLARLLDKDTWSAVGAAYSSMVAFNVRLAMAKGGKEVLSSILLEMEEASEAILEPIQDNFVTDAWMVEVFEVYERVVYAMKLLERQFVSEESKAEAKSKVDGKAKGPHLAAEDVKES